MTTPSEEQQRHLSEQGWGSESNGSATKVNDDGKTEIIWPDGDHYRKADDNYRLHHFSENK